MKFRTPLVVAILASGANAQAVNPCNICPDGVTVTVEGDDTCISVIEEAKVFEAGSDECEGETYQDYKLLCCPTPLDNPCIICPDGATAGDDYAPFADDGDSTTCTDLIDQAKVYEAGTESCDLFKGNQGYEGICCPTPVDNPCTICPEGVTAGDVYAPFADDGDSTTCKDLIDQVKVYEAGSQTCDLFKGNQGYEGICCPTPVDNPCVICSGGATAGDDYAPYANGGDNTTCKELIEYAKIFESGTEFCESSQWSEYVCCPTVAENPCTLCPEGATAGDDYAPFGDGDPTTCKDLIDQGKVYEAGSQTCDIFTGNQGYEGLCCPTPLDNPCIICPGGATAGDDYVPYAEDDGDNTTCKEIIESVKMFETGTGFCELGQWSEYACCPTVAENPCTICPGGATAGDDYAPYAEDGGDNTTCKEIIEYVKTFETGTEFCELYQGTEYACCPTVAENPCTICPEGATAGDDYAPYAEDGGDNTTCKEIIEYTKIFETGTEFCDETSQWSEYACCPTPAENPCTLCPNGATAGDDYAPFADDGDSTTCKDVIAETQLFDAGSEFCKSYLPIEIYCCPTVAENPCICPDGLTVDGDIIIPDSGNLTCKEGLEFAKSVDANSDLCDETLKEGAMLCCPPTTDTEELTSTVAASTAAPELEESSSTAVSSTVPPTSTDAATTAVPESTEAATTVSPGEPEEILSTVTIDESTSTITASTTSASTTSASTDQSPLTTQSTSTPGSATLSDPAPDDATESESGAFMFGSCFGGFALMPIASALYAVAFM